MSQTSVRRREETSHSLMKRVLSSFKTLFYRLMKRGSSTKMVSFYFPMIDYAVAFSYSLGSTRNIKQLSFGLSHTTRLKKRR
jgi:hypothetical protein